MRKILRFVTKSPDATAQDLLLPVSAIFGEGILQLFALDRVLAELRDRGTATVVRYIPRELMPALMAQVDPTGRVPGLGVTLTVRREYRYEPTGQIDPETGTEILRAIPTGWQADLVVTPGHLTPLIEQAFQSTGTQVDLPTRSDGTVTVWKAPAGDAYLLPDDPDRTWDVDYPEWQPPEVVTDPVPPPT